MSNPHTRLMSEDEEIAYDSGLMDGRDKERARILKLLESSLPEATKVGLFFTDGLLKAINLIRENK